MDTTLALPATMSFGKRYEFLAFSVVIFIAKSFLLVRMPYRPAERNALFTVAILAFFYCYLRFRQNIRVPLFLLGFLAIAVGEDVAGNYFHLYGTNVGPFAFDEITHFFGCGLALPPTFWMLRTTTRRIGLRIPNDLIAFFSVTITFSLAAYYEILELWDERFWGGRRIWSTQDTANDLQFGLMAIVISAITTHFVWKLIDRRKVSLALA